MVPLAAAARAMWICGQCGEKLEDQFKTCWRCSAGRPIGGEQDAVAGGTGTQPSPSVKLNYRMFRGTLATWNDLFMKAAYFATEIGRERVLNISHSADDGDGVVTVWYWELSDAVPPLVGPVPPK
jgi:hypothetical protein